MMNNINRLELEILTAFVLQKNRAYLFAYPETVLTHQQQKLLEKLIQKRLQGIPIAYLVGKREFWSLDFNVTPAVLIPRHETELLIEIGLKLLPENQSLSLLELGTGCGAISIAIAKERPNWNITATDISIAALTIAKENLFCHHIKNIAVVYSDWFSGLTGQFFHAIISNPPYIAETDPHLKQGDLPFEPTLALVSGKEGLDAIGIIISQAQRFLVPDGWMLLEHGYDQAEHVQTIFRQNNFKNVTTYRDMNNLPRVTCAKVAR
jgi:release factor glutamine methyltransferase